MAIRNDVVLSYGIDILRFFSRRYNTHMQDTQQTMAFPGSARTMHVLFLL